MDYQIIYINIVKNTKTLRQSCEIIIRYQLGYHYPLSIIFDLTLSTKSNSYFLTYVAFSYSDAKSLHILVALSNISPFLTYYIILYKYLLSFLLHYQ